MNDKKLDFWNKRSSLEERAGSNDTIAKSLEIDAIDSYISDGQVLLEFGCGNGATACEIARRKNVNITAVDFSEDMVKEANEYAKKNKVEDKVSFFVSDIRDFKGFMYKFDCIYTERMIINLNSWEEQSYAIKKLASFLKPSGKLLLCENSQNGFDNLNKLRNLADLVEITAPWHNLYLNDSKMDLLEIHKCNLIDVNSYSSTYYFLSRVVNAWLSKLESVEPSYDAPINKLATLLPPMSGCSQGKLWVWECDK